MKEEGRGGARKGSGRRSGFKNPNAGRKRLKFKGNKDVFYSMRLENVGTFGAPEIKQAIDFLSKVERIKFHSTDDGEISFIFEGIGKVTFAEEKVIYG